MRMFFPSTTKQDDSNQDAFNLPRNWLWLWRWLKYSAERQAIIWRHQTNWKFPIDKTTVSHGLCNNSLPLNRSSDQKSIHVGNQMHGGLLTTVVLSATLITELAKRSWDRLISRGLIFTWWAFELCKWEIFHASTVPSHVINIGIRLPRLLSSIRTAEDHFHEERHSPCAITVCSKAGNNEGYFIHVEDQLQWLCIVLQMGRKPHKKYRELRFRVANLSGYILTRTSVWPFNNTLSNKLTKSSQ